MLGCDTNRHFPCNMSFIDNNTGPSFLIYLTFVIYVSGKPKHSLMVIGKVITNKKDHFSPFPLASSAEVARCLELL